MLDKVWNREKEYADYYIQQTGSRFDMCQTDVMRQLYYMQGISDIAQLVDTKMANEWLKAANAIYAVYQAKGGQPFESR